MSIVRFGIAGLGNMGKYHARSLQQGKVSNAVLSAVADPFSDLEAYGGQVKGFRSSEEMICSGEIDAVIIATPHYSHTQLGIEALKAGLHVIVEKPISVHKADAERLLSAHTNPKQVFAAMFNMRTHSIYRRLRELIQRGELGGLKRISWTITDWFRLENYYKSGGWRATWEGEGGGVLLNQCPHNLDLLWWMIGMPNRVQAHCRFGRYHNIEVEDDVTAFLEYPGGITGLFVTSTGESPGVNRLEIACDRGSVVVESGEIRWARTEVPVSQYCADPNSRPGHPPIWNVTVPYSAEKTGHIGIIQNVVNSILHGEPLLSPASEGIYSVELANAMLLSTFLGKPVDLPMDGSIYEAELQKRICESKARRS